RRAPRHPGGDPRPSPSRAHGVTSALSAVAWVGLGANLGRRTAALAALRRELTRGSVRLEAASPELLTRAVGVRRQPDFHNQVVRLRSPTPWRAEAWLGHCERAAVAAGRRPTYHWGPRRADADVLLPGERGELHVDRPGLCVPHPELAERPFLCELLDEHRAAERGEADVDAGPVVGGERLAEQGLHRVEPAGDLAELLELVAAVAEDELRLDLDEGLGLEPPVGAVLLLLLVVVEVAVGARAV